MGIIRKTVSVTTLGVVPFRSKKERLRRAESAYRHAAEDLAREQLARAHADDRVAAAEKRAQQAELVALHEAKVATKERRKAAKADRRHRPHGPRRRRDRHDDRPIRESVDELLKTVQPAVESGMQTAKRRGRITARRATKAAERATKRARTHLDV